jgi:hypothetical protein
MAVKEDNRVMMISDGWVIEGDITHPVDSKNNYAIQKYGSLFVGMTGDLPSIRYLRQNFDFNKLRNFTVEKFYEILWKFVIENISHFPCAEFKNEAITNLGVSFLFVENQRIFTSDFDIFGLLEYSSFFSIGNNSDSIMGSFLSLRENHQIYDAVIKSVQHTFKTSDKSGFPLYIWYSDSNQVTIIKDKSLKEMKEKVFYNRPVKGEK